MMGMRRKVLRSSKVINVYREGTSSDTFDRAKFGTSERATSSVLR